MNQELKKGEEKKEMKSYTIKLDVTLILEAEESINPYDVIDDMDYGFISTIEGAVIRDTKITDFVVIPEIR